MRKVHPYGDAAGRTSSRQTQFHVQPGQTGLYLLTDAFDQSFQWNPQGLPTQMSYPLRQDEATCGARLAFHTYYPFGEEATTFNQDTDRLKFTGHERDLGSAAGAGDDVDYMHARFCSPILGRFWSVDPSGASADPKNPQSWNR